MKLPDNELKKVVGGAITATFVNAIMKGAQVIFDIGKSFGSSLRRIFSSDICPL